MFVVRYRKIFYALSAVLLAVSFYAMYKPGFNLGIDFKGGSILQVSYVGERPDLNTAQEALEPLDLGNYVIQPTGSNAFTLRTRELSEAEKEQVKTALTVDAASSVKEDLFSTVGPVVGAELRQKAFTGIALVIICIVLFVTYAFRKVSEPVASWKYGLATIIALAHDVVVPAGVFFLLSSRIGGEVDLLFVAALLSILGYSVHDTIVVFDRVRENLRRNRDERLKRDFETTVGESVSETFGRSINTSITIFLVLVALYFVGPAATKNFALLLLIGVIMGTYSSIFVASPLLVTFEKWQHRKRS